ncbi:hypothetical protein A4X13_0g8331, partial [Tilletia indica]
TSALNISCLFGPAGWTPSTSSAPSTPSISPVRSQVIPKQAFAAADSVTNEGLGTSKFISGVIRPQSASKQYRNSIDSPSQCSTLIIFNLSLASKVVLRRRPAVPFSFSSTLPMSDPHHLQSFSS